MSRRGYESLVEGGTAIFKLYPWWCYSLENRIDYAKNNLAQMLTYYDTENFWANDQPMTGSNPFLGSMCEKYLDKSLRDDKNTAFSG